MQLVTAAVVVVGVWLLLPVLTATTFDVGHAVTVGIRIGGSRRRSWSGWA